MLDYLPDSMDTVIGQDQLLEDFGKGAFSFIVVENMPIGNAVTAVRKDKGRRARRDGAVVPTLADLPFRRRYCRMSCTGSSTPTMPLLKSPCSSTAPPRPGRHHGCHPGDSFP